MPRVTADIGGIGAGVGAGMTARGAIAGRRIEAGGGMGETILAPGHLPPITIIIATMAIIAHVIRPMC